MSIARLLKTIASDLWEKGERDKELIELATDLENSDEMKVMSPGGRLLYDDLALLKMCKNVTKQIYDRLSRRKRILELEVMTVELPGRRTSVGSFLVQR